MAETDVRMTMPMQAIAQHVRVTVKVTGVRTFGARLWVAGQLMRLAAWVAGVGIQFEK